MGQLGVSAAADHFQSPLTLFPLVRMCSLLSAQNSAAGSQSRAVSLFPWLQTIPKGAASLPNCSSTAASHAVPLSPLPPKGIVARVNRTSIIMHYELLSEMLVKCTWL